ncbi:hypothetical protein FOZ63_010255, partial [Perkinsus olseni]
MTKAEYNHKHSTLRKEYDGPLLDWKQQQQQLSMLTAMYCTRFFLLSSLMAATTATTIQEFIGNVVTSVDGIDSITIADREGVEILSAPSTKPSNDEQSDEQILTTIFSLTSDQVGQYEECAYPLLPLASPRSMWSSSSSFQCMKLPEFGACSFVLAGYGDGKQLLQATDNPLVITI